MSYGNEYSSKPFEGASKNAHSEVINDPMVRNFLARCHIPPSEGDMDGKEFVFHQLENLEKNPIRNIITIDGGYSIVPVKESFPSSTVAFLQFGVLMFPYENLLNLEKKAFIDPEDIKKMHEIQKIKLVLPTKGISLNEEKDLVSSVRKTIYDFFRGFPATSDDPEAKTYMQSLKWFLFEEYRTAGNKKPWHLARCPLCDQGTDISPGDVKPDFTMQCRTCGGKIFLTDVFRLHEAMDNELGAGGVVSYLAMAIEHMTIIAIIHHILDSNIKKFFSSTLFIKDGPLAFFGQTANMHKPMRNLIRFLHEKESIYLVGLEKSGSFVEHAQQIQQKMQPNQYMVLGNRHIYKYIIPGIPGDNRPYGDTSYFGNKVIFKSKHGHTYVATVPNLDAKEEPKPEDCLNLNVILHNITALKCDLFYNSLLPIVLVNKLVSLADHPSSDILCRFAKENIQCGK